MIYVFTGDGKGKTTAALGVGLRAIGAGKKVLMIQFLKPGDSSESKILSELNNFELKSFGREGFFVSESQLKENPELEEQGVKTFEKKDKELAQKGLSTAQKSLGNYDVIILDEINLAMRYNLIEQEQILKFLNKVDNTHIILTGRDCPEQVASKADLVTECKEVKHYYHQGHEPVKGIDL